MGLQLGQGSEEAVVAGTSDETVVSRSEEIVVVGLVE